MPTAAPSSTKLKLPLNIEIHEVFKPRFFILTSRKRESNVICPLADQPSWTAQW